MKILHVTAHMGAGAGKAISGLAMSDNLNQHKVMVLEKPEKMNHVKRCEQKGIAVVINPSREQILREIDETDVVVLNWWHHPLTYSFLKEIKDIPIRIVLWSHVNGLNYPKLKPQFAKCFDGTMFTSKASLQNGDWSEEEKEFIQLNSELVYGMGDFEPHSFQLKRDYSISQEVKIGYVGTLDYAKLHPDFVKWLKNYINSNLNVKFTIVGDPTLEIIEDVKKSGISEYVEFLGFRTDIPEILHEWDVFIYPLNPINFATTENALIEAMAAGLPVIASDGIVEQSIIEEGKTGFLVSDENSFVNRLNELLESKELRSNLGRNARQSVIETYDKQVNLKYFLQVIDKAMKRKKEVHDFLSVVGSNSFQWFLIGCGKKETKLLEEIAVYKPQTKEWDEAIRKITELGRIYRGESKGSIKQFKKYYPEDQGLDTLINIMQEK